MLRQPAILVLALVMAPAAVAQTAPDSDARYTFHRVEDGFLRLDNRSGQLSLCVRKNTAWACQPVADERAAIEAEMSRLQRENAALKKELLSRGALLPNGVKPEAKSEQPASKRADPELKMPSSADLERAKALIDKMWQRLVDVIAGLQRDTREKI